MTTRPEKIVLPMQVSDAGKFPGKVRLGQTAGACEAFLPSAEPAYQPGGFEKLIPEIPFNR